MHRTQAIDARAPAGKALAGADSLAQSAGLARRLALLWTGHLLMGVGLLGMLLPLLPTTVFWICAAVCYAKSSPERYRRLVGRGRTGQVIQNYLEYGVIPTKGKWLATFSMLMSAALLWFAPVGNVATIVGLAGLALAATYVLTRPAAAPTDQ